MTTLVRFGVPGGVSLLVLEVDETVIVPSPPDGLIRRLLRLRAINEDTASRTLKTRIKETDTDKVAEGAPEYVPVYPTAWPALKTGEMRDDHAPADSEILLLSPTQQVVEELDAKPTVGTAGVAYLASWIDEVGVLK